MAVAYRQRNRVDAVIARPALGSIGRIGAGNGRAVEGQARWQVGRIDREGQRVRAIRIGRILRHIQRCRCRAVGAGLLRNVGIGIGGRCA